MKKKELYFKLFGDENPTFLTTREKMIIDFCLKIIKSKDDDIKILTKKRE